MRHLFPGDSKDDAKSLEDSEWWMAEMTAPEDKMKIDFVFTTSQDPKVGRYDNNNGQDYHARVLIERADDDTYWEERAEERFKMIREQRAVEEEAKARFNKEREELKQVLVTRERF